MNTSLQLSVTLTAVIVFASVAGTAESADLDDSLVSSTATSSNKYGVKVDGGLAFSEFEGYESWEVVALSQSGGRLAAIVGNESMIDAYKAGIPGNGRPFPDGARFAKVHWQTRTNDTAPGQPAVPGTLLDVDFMVKDATRFADSGGWGYAAFKYDVASNSFVPFTQEDHPPQGKDAKCGFACHTVAKARDYVFTEYAKR